MPNLSVKRDAILQALLFVLLLPSVAIADLSASKVTQAAKRIHPTVIWDSTSIVGGDFNGDGQWDAAIVGTHQQRVFVAVVLSAETRKIKTEVLSFCIGTHTTDSICGLPTKLTVEPLECSPLDGDSLPGCRPSPVAASLALYGGECDPINFYWDHQNNRLAWWRM